MVSRTRSLASNDLPHTSYMREEVEEGTPQLTADRYRSYYPHGIADIADNLSVEV